MFETVTVIRLLQTDNLSRFKSGVMKNYVAKFVFG